MKLKRRANPQNRISQKWKCGNCDKMNRKTHGKCDHCQAQRS